MTKRRRTVRKLVAQLGGNSFEMRSSAEAALYNLGPDAITDVIAELERTILNVRRLPLTIVATIICVPMICFAIFRLLWPNSSFWAGGATGFVCVSLCLLPGWFQSSRNEAARVLSGLQDMRAVGPLARAMGHVSPWVGTNIGDALIRLLPRWREADFSLLDAPARVALNELLLHDRKALVKVVLDAILRIGNGTSIPFVKRLADGEGQAATGADLRAAAEKCLPVLIERVSRESNQATLLRPSESGLLGHATLVRPAISSIGGLTEILLQPVVKPSPDEQQNGKIA